MNCEVIDQPCMLFLFVALPDQKSDISTYRVILCERDFLLLTEKNDYS